MNLRTYLRIKTASMDKAADDASDRRDYKFGKKELEKTLAGFKRTLDDETTYPGYGYTQDMLGPYGVLRAVDEYNGSIPAMPHIPYTFVYRDDDGDTLSSTSYNRSDKLELSPFGAITKEPSIVFTDSKDSEPAGWASTNLGIENPSFFGRLFGRKTINNPSVDQVAYDIKDTLAAMKYYYRKHPEVYKRALTNYGWRLSSDKAEGGAYDKEIDDFGF